MRRKEEIYARRLYYDLETALTNKPFSLHKMFGLASRRLSDEVSIRLEEAGTQSNCTVAKDRRKCNIHCFDIDQRNVAYKGPQYYTTFDEAGTTICTGRTIKKDKTIEAVRMWMNGATLDDLYAASIFIDQDKRALEQCRRHQ